MVVRAAPLVIASSVRRAKSFRIGNRASCAEFEFAFYRGEVGSRLISLTINQLSPVSISPGSFSFTTGRWSSSRLHVTARASRS